jgi:hypothetical protein
VQDVRFILRPSRVRLWFALAALAGAGLVLIWIAFAVAEAGVVLRASCLAAAVALFLAAGRLRDAGSRALILTEAGLADTRHGLLCGLGDIVRVERGAFALKPARGFALRLAQPGPRTWVPGLWWRMGRTIGVGGLTGAGETRLMADMIEAMVAARALSQVPAPPCQRI